MTIGTTPSTTHHECLGRRVAPRDTAPADGVSSSWRANHLVRALLDRLAFGVIVTDGHGRVMIANHAAERILASSGVLAVDRSGRADLRSRRHPDFHDRLVLAARRGRYDGALEALALRGEGSESLAVAFGPLDVGEPAALVIVTQRDDQRRHVATTLRQLYGLTGAEARIAAEFAYGGELAAIAERLGITLSTARTHLKRIFGKVDVPNQAALMRTLVTGPAGLARLLLPVPPT